MAAKTSGGSSLTLELIELLERGFWVLVVEPEEEDEEVQGDDQGG